MTQRSRRQELLALARISIEGALRGEPPPEIRERPHSDEFTHGVFVTLKIAGDLRGCIGTLAAEEGIARTVVEYARHAAFDDSRFPPVTKLEWSSVEIEISVMTPPRAISPAEVEPGRHGLILEAGPRRGLLLPQVATEWKMSREDFLDAVAKKAGLASDAWNDPDARLFGFEAEVFSERDFAGGE